MTDCLFCRIVARQTPADIEYEDDAVLAFKDIYPKAPVHILIVPRLHLASISEMTEEHVDAVGRCLLAARKIAETKGFGERGYRVNVNTGPEGGQVVYHVHFHFLAGWASKGGSTHMGAPTAPNPPRSETPRRSRDAPRS